MPTARSCLRRSYGVDREEDARDDPGVAEHDHGGLAVTALPAERRGHPPSPDLMERRVNLRATAVTDVPEGVVTRSAKMADVDAIICEVAEPGVDILYLHGGDYRVGAAKMWTNFCARLAARTAGRVHNVEYRLAPEHPFPAALNDALAAFQVMRAQGLPSAVVGDSAGGGLAAALVLATLESGEGLPDCLVLLSPWLDLTVTSGSYRTRAATDTVFSSDAATSAASMYLQGAPADSPLASPLFGTLEGFPPTQLIAGGDEVLLEDSTSFAARLALAGSTVEAHFVGGMQHLRPATDLAAPEAIVALDDITRFIGSVQPSAS